MVDGLAIAEHLRVVEPDTFQTLTACRWVWANRSTTTDVRWSAPVIAMDGDRIDEIRLTNALRLFPDVAHEQVDGAYRALRRFVELVDDPRFRATFPFAAGDCLLFDNRRILHGRESFQKGTGQRHLRGCYVDRDDYLSQLRMLARQTR